MSKSRLVVVCIGASAGGLEPIVTITKALSRSDCFAVLVVQHQRAARFSYLPELLSLSTSLNVCLAADQMLLLPGTIYVAPPGHHLTVEGRVVRTSVGPPIGFLRPSIDLCFESVAEHYGRAALGVVLSGTGGDGAKGLWRIKNLQGQTIAQDPREAKSSAMVEHAIKSGVVDYIEPAASIVARLRSIAP